MLSGSLEIHSTQFLRVNELLRREIAQARMPGCFISGVRDQYCLHTFFISESYFFHRLSEPILGLFLAQPT